MVGPYESSPLDAHDGQCTYCRDPFEDLPRIERVTERVYQHWIASGLTHGFGGSPIRRARWVRLRKLRSEARSAHRMCVDCGYALGDEDDRDMCAGCVEPDYDYEAALSQACAIRQGGQS